METAEPLRKLDVPVSVLPSCLSLTLGSTLPPSDIVKDHFHVPSSFDSFGDSEFSAAPSRNAPLVATHAKVRASLLAIFRTRLQVGWSCRHDKIQADLLFVLVIAPAVMDRDFISTVVHGDEAERAFVPSNAINALAVRAAFDGWRLVQRSTAHNRNRSAAARREIAVASIIGSEHVGIAVKNRQTADSVGFDEVSDFAPLRWEHAPMVFIAGSAIRATA